MLTSRDSFTQNQDPLFSIRDRRIFDGMKAFFSTEMLFLSGWLFWALNGSFRGIDQDMIRTFNKLPRVLEDHQWYVWVKLSDFFAFALK